MSVLSISFLSSQFYARAVGQKSKQTYVIVIPRQIPWFFQELFKWRRNLYFLLSKSPRIGFFIDSHQQKPALVLHGEQKVLRQNESFASFAPTRKQSKIQHTSQQKNE